MKKFLGSITSVLFVLIALSFPQTASAADIRTAETITIAENQTNLKDLYLFGSDIRVDAPVINDVVTGGSDIVLNGDISNDLIAAGGKVTVRGKIGNTARIAGGTISINGPIENDLVITGGTVFIGKEATIGGDLLFAGGKLSVDAPVHGKILMTGKDITINNTVDGDVTAGEVRQLTLGPNAKIAGNLSYTSASQAQQSAGSKILGKNEMHLSEKNQENHVLSFIKGSLYKLTIDIILSVLLIYFFKQGVQTLFIRMKENSLKNGAIGGAFIFFMPIVSIICLILIWLGFAALLSYALILLISVFLVKLFLGWLLVRWWYTRQKQTYLLDWKAGVVGPILLFLLLLIPVLGWIVAAILFCIATGAFLKELLNLVPKLQGSTKKK